MEFLRLFLWRHLAGKPVIVLSNVSCFLRLAIETILFIIFEGLCHSTCVSGDLATFHKLLSPFLSYWQNRSRDKVFWGVDSKELNPILDILLRNTKSVFSLKNLVYSFS